MCCLGCHATRAGHRIRMKVKGRGGGGVVIVQKGKSLEKLKVSKKLRFELCCWLHSVSIGVSISLRKKYMTLGRLLQERAIWLLL